MPCAQGRPADQAGVTQPSAEPYALTYVFAISSTCSPPPPMFAAAEQAGSLQTAATLKQANTQATLPQHSYHLTDAAAGS